MNNETYIVHRIRHKIFDSTQDHPKRWGAIPMRSNFLPFEREVFEIYQSLDPGYSGKLAEHLQSLQPTSRRMTRLRALRLR